MLTGNGLIVIIGGYFNMKQKYQKHGIYCFHDTSQFIMHSTDGLSLFFAARVLETKLLNERSSKVSFSCFQFKETDQPGSDICCRIQRNLACALNLFSPKQRAR
jgi:hypothetical protein